MTWRVKIENNFSANGISIHLGKKTDQGLLVIEPMTMMYTDIEPSTMSPAALHLEDELGKALLEELTLHYGGISDHRTLRQDYLAERVRVDKFMDYFLRK